MRWQLELMKLSGSNRDQIVVDCESELRELRFKGRITRITRIISFPRNSPAKEELYKISRNDDLLPRNNKPWHRYWHRAKLPLVLISEKVTIFKG